MVSTFLVSDQSNVRETIEKVWLPYIQMNDNDFVKVTRKAVADLFDWSIQIDQNLNAEIRDILINDGGVATEMMEFVREVKQDKDHDLHYNHIIDIVKIELSRKADDTNSPNNIRVKGTSNEVYDKNNIIFAFRELRDYLKGVNNPLYQRLIHLAILQSGLSSSTLSFTDVIPYEDFRDIYNLTLSKLSNAHGLEEFYNLRVFQRNNWGNDDIVPHMKASLIPRAGERGPIYNPAMLFYGERKHVEQAIDRNIIPQLITIRQRTKEGGSEHIVYTWEKGEEILPKDWRRIFNTNSKWDALRTLKREMGSKGDYSYINKGLFEKVVDEYGVPLETDIQTRKTGEWVPQYVYKAINAWGDGFRANEFYEVEKQSVIDNGFIKVEGVPNSVIIDVFNKKSPQRVNRPTTSKVNVQSSLAMQPDNITKIKGKDKTMTTRSYKVKDGNHILPDGTVISTKGLGEISTTSISDLRTLAENLGTINLNNKNEMTRANILNEYAKAEGFKSLGDMKKNAKYDHTKQFLDGKTKMWVYKITPNAVEKSLRTKKGGATNVTKIISGGQTGVDVAGLDAAVELGISTGGTAAAKYTQSTAKGTVLNPSLKTKYGLREGKSIRKEGRYGVYDDVYSQRTIDNAQEADGTIWFGNEKISRRNTYIRKKCPKRKT